MPNDSSERLFFAQFVTIGNEEEVRSDLQHFRYLSETTNTDRFSSAFDLSKIIRTEMCLYSQSFLTEFQLFAVATNIIANDFIKIHTANLQA